GNNGYSAAEELVEGIESMQLLFGLDNNAVITPASPPTGNITTQAIASGVTTAANASGAGEWRRVGQVQVGILARSPQP
ncbi:PilW family protein, partial [Bacillus sp. SIMBA_008]